jgi:hypothetical protein
MIETEDLLNGGNIFNIILFTTFQNHFSTHSFEEMSR